MRLLFKTYAASKLEVADRTHRAGSGSNRRSARRASARDGTWERHQATQNSSPSSVALASTCSLLFSRSMRAPKGCSPATPTRSQPSSRPRSHTLRTWSRASDRLQAADPGGKSPRREPQFRPLDLTPITYSPRGEAISSRSLATRASPQLIERGSGCRAVPARSRTAASILRTRPVLKRPWGLLGFATAWRVKSLVNFELPARVDAARRRRLNRV
jgi:hypothetical protein